MSNTREWYFGERRLKKKGHNTIRLKIEDARIGYRLIVTRGDAQHKHWHLTWTGTVEHLQGMTTTAQVAGYTLEQGRG